jgi:hypothetical protein
VGGREENTGFGVSRRASLLIVPDHRIAIAVASNVSGAENVSRLAIRLADVFVGFLQAL